MQRVKYEDLCVPYIQVSNFGMSLVQYYCNSPRTLAQLHLRRDPPQGAATLDQRLKALDANVLAAAAERLLQLQTNLTRDNGLVVSTTQ